MAFHNQIHAGQAPVPSSATIAFEDTVWAPSTGVYLTDETTLFRVEDIISHRHELLLELEDCASLELILCPARKLSETGLRTVTPAA